MKYVAFLDILGFKEKLKSMTHYEARQFIGNFSATTYAVWRELDPSYLTGYIVSDSFIIYSCDISQDALLELLKVIDSICKIEFSRLSIVLRGAIAKGEFDKLEAREMSSLKKGLFVGQAYVDAYLLESAVKTAGIVLSNDVYQDLRNIGGLEKNLFTESVDSTKYNIYRYLTLDFLLEPKKMEKFVELANKSGWLPHFYNSLYLALRNESNENKVDQVFLNLLNTVSNNKPTENWREVDLFLRNAFSQNVFFDFQKRLLKYIRKNLF